MATREPRYTKFRLDWHRQPTADGTPSWWCAMGGVRVAEASMTGRPGVDNYPWDWFLTDTGKGLARRGRAVGVTDTLRAAKEQVRIALEP